MRWYWYPKGNPFKNWYRVIWPKHPLCLAAGVPVPQSKIGNLKSKAEVRGWHRDGVASWRRPQGAAQGTERSQSKFQNLH